jgi:hypothetical protein
MTSTSAMTPQRQSQRRRVIAASRSDEREAAHRLPLLTSRAVQSVRYLDDGNGRRFVARSRYRRALALYRRARALDRDPGLAAGEARALAGLGEHARAARLADEAARALGRPADLQVRVVDDLEHARNYAAAAKAAMRLAADPRFPRRPALFFTIEHADAPLQDHDALGPLSLGAGRLTATSFEIRPRLGRQSAVAPTVVELLPFLPLYRPDELSRYDRGAPRGRRGATWSSPGARARRSRGSRRPSGRSTATAVVTTARRCSPPWRRPRRARRTAPPRG